jgi:hypothetical protein
MANRCRVHASHDLSRKRWLLLHIRVKGTMRCNLSHYQKEQTFMPKPSNLIQRGQNVRADLLDNAMEAQLAA